MTDRQPDSPTQIEALAQQLFDAIERGDVDTLRDLYHADARIWHNTDGAEQSVEQNLRVLRWLVRNTSLRRYEEVRREMLATGFVQMHVLRLDLASGRTVHIPACLVARVADGRITRIDEYLDSAQLAGLGA
jgi:ketosteroid isomerase-like protein